MNTFKKNKELIGYSFSMAILILILNLLEFNFTIIQNKNNLYVGIIALIFTLLGIWISQKIVKPETKTIVVEKEIVVQKNLNFCINQNELEARKISKRELEVLQLMAEGMSNQEIASRLFVSLNTIKTHSSNLFVKLDVKRRTQAIEIAKKLELIP